MYMFSTSRWHWILQNIFQTTSQRLVQQGMCWINIWIIFVNTQKLLHADNLLKPFFHSLIHSLKYRDFHDSFKYIFRMLIKQTVSCWYSSYRLKHKYTTLLLFVFLQISFFIRNLFLCRTVEKHTTRSEAEKINPKVLPDSSLTRRQGEKVLGDSHKLN